MSMRAGQLTKRITIQRPPTTETRNSFGEVVESWEKVCDAWAAVFPLSGREILRSQQVQPDITHRVVMRHRSGIEPKHRILFGDRVLQIETVINLEESGERLELLCKEAV